MSTGRPKLLHLNKSQSQRILWLLEELGIEYDLETFEREKTGAEKDRAPAELAKTHPLGKSPQLITADGRVIIESVAIAGYLIRTYDTAKRFQGDPATGNDELRDDILTELGSASIGIVMTIQMIFQRVATMAPFFIRPVFNGTSSMISKKFTGPELDKFFKFLESELGEQDYFMGTNPGRADFILSWPFDFCTQQKFIDLKKYPALDRWHARCKARDAWKRSLEKGNGYELAY